jgi:hypothetical protein
MTDSTQKLVRLKQKHREQLKFMRRLVQEQLNKKNKEIIQLKKEKNDMNYNYRKKLQNQELKYFELIQELKLAQNKNHKIHIPYYLFR